MNLFEALGTGGETAVIGMGIVFGVLVILFIVLYLFKLIFYRQAMTEEKPKEIMEPGSVIEEIAEETVPELASGAIEISDEEDDEQLIAVITAAIAAALNTSTYKLNIRSIRRTGTSRSAWNRAGLNETISSRL